MNFFGHAVLAQRVDASRGSFRAQFVLGAMLPDFASMLLRRPPRVSLDDIQHGVAFHHLSDEAFHGAETFLDISRAAREFLGSRGLSRGAARAVAHVGVELLLDSALARENLANEAYLCAVECALQPDVASRIHWPRSEDHARFQHLCHKLLERGAVSDDTPADVIAERLRHILAPRPRLALDDAGQFVVREWAMAARPLIVARAPRLLCEVEQRLEDRSFLER